MNLSLYMAGVGGQGVLTIADILMAAALEKNIPCNYYPTKGMAQRGGYVKAQLRFGESETGPDIRIGGADIVIGMELSESLRAIDYLKRGGDMVVYPHRWYPTAVMLGSAYYPNIKAVEEHIKKRTDSYVFLDESLLPEGGADNIFLLAAAHKHTALKDMFTADELFDAVAARFPKGIERNRASFEAGKNT